MPEVSTSAKDFSGLNLRLPQAMSVPFMQDKQTGEHSFMGLPYRGAAGALKNDDPHYQQPQYHMDVHIRQFDTTNTEELEAWTKIMQEVADGIAIISVEERQYDPELKGWRILLRWCSPHFDAPSKEPAIP